MQAENDLDRLAAEHGSDKFGTHRYTPHYHEHFERLRNEHLHLLEIGIGGYSLPDHGGASLKMWRDYFCNATIYGLDFYEKTGLAEDRVKIFQGSQVDPRVITKLLSSTPNEAFDIVIDDASHRSEHVVGTFQMLFQFVSAGGWYVIEDTETSYWPDYGGSHSDSLQRLTTMGFFKQLVDNINWKDRDLHHPNYSPNYLDLNISGINFYKNMIFVRKAFSV